MSATVSRRELLKGRPAGARALLPDPRGVQIGDPADLGVVEAAALLQARRLSSRELTEACLARIEQRDPFLNAWVRTYPELALQQADAADQRLAGARRGSLAPLVCGIPLGLKDLYAVEGLPLTASSRVLEGNVARGDSTVWALLRRNGMVLLGHTQMHEFAAGVATPQTGNPWDPSRSPGGSSGGSGAALGARMVPAATGSDTGGSLRSPASACGVSSIKPTYGRVSTYGLIPCVWTLDHAGPMARSAADVALLLDHIAEPDPRDPASLAPPPRPATYLCAPTPGPRPLAGLRLGVPDGAADSLPAGTARLWASYLGEVRDLGATVVGFAAPATEPSILSALGEAWAYHQQFGPAALARYTPEVAALVVAARAAAESPTGDYIDYQRQRMRYANAWRETLAGLRLTAVLKPGSSVDGATRDQTTGLTIFTGSVSGDYGWADAAGLPVAMTPVGRSASTGMPFGVQIGGAPHDEATLLRIAIDYQAAHPYWAEAPPEPPAAAGQANPAIGGLVSGQIPPGR